VLETLKTEGMPRKGARGRYGSSTQSSGNDELVLEIEGHQVKCTRLNKVLYPQTRTTKADVIDYYVRIAPFILPHLKNRPVTLKRYPDGVTGQAFWEKDAPSFTPQWVNTYPVPRRAGGPDIQYTLVENTATLAWLANAATLELHPFLHRAPKMESPTSIVFDLPGEGVDLLQCIEVAVEIRTVLARLGLELFPKVSGSKGLQLYAPLNSPSSYAVTQPFARSVAQWIERQHPGLAVSEMPKAQRVGKVFIDWSQNADHKTTVGVYSLRAKQERPFVSMPVTWDELSRALKRKKIDQLYSDPKATLTRLEETGDVFADVLKLKQALPQDLATAIQVEKKREGRTVKQLHEYSLKPDFAVTAEPAASAPRASVQGSRRRFVVQKHAASHLHYDFRLEMHEGLKSWAVPKGVPTELDVRRFASATEDHPIDYLEFEGVIPPGQYGGGTVMV
jgi:bifunctional non-homologous end joining protein LigD